VLDISELSLNEGAFLVRLARQAVTEYFHGRKLSPPSDTPSRLWERAGVFVTIELHGVPVHQRLRGCIGYPRPVMPLVQATIDAAIQAAFLDPRFEPLREDELGHVTFEVSVLSEPRLLKVNDPRKLPRMIVVGRDGLIIEKEPFAGLLLPQVPVEYGWDSELYLMEACLKAGLPPDAWLDLDTKIYVFQAVIFREMKPKGDVLKRDLLKELRSR